MWILVSIPCKKSCGQAIDFYQRIFSGLVNRWVEILLVEIIRTTHWFQIPQAFKALELGNRFTPRKKIIFAPIISYTYFRNCIITIKIDRDVTISKINLLRKIWKNTLKLDQNWTPVVSHHARHGKAYIINVLPIDAFNCLHFYMLYISQKVPTTQNLNYK